MTAALSTYYSQQAARQHRAVVFWFPENKASLELVEQQLQKLQAVFVHQVANFRTLLGTEHTLLYYRLDTSWNANALVGLTGTLQGAGLLLIALDQETADIPSLQHWQGSFPSEQTFHCRSSKELVQWLQGWPIQQTAAQAPRPFIANHMQRQALKQLQQLEGRQALVLYAPRGRGKTATLAHWLGMPYPFTQRFICAPSKLQAAPLLAKAPDAIFLPPDQLATHGFNKQDLLLIDEAATLPMPGQNAALTFPGCLVLATTTEGYEYAGRGFIIRFVHVLKEHFPSLYTMYLEQPMRWQQGDALERANNLAFGLYPNDQVHTSIRPPESHATEATGTVEYVFSHCHKYSHAERFAIFRLLVEAHYQTSPNDIQRLLDDPSQRLLVQWQVTTDTKQVLGVTWLSAEGPIEKSLASSVARGKRRLPGQLLPQAYAYYGKSPALAALRHLRVVRIAVASKYQGFGYGSAALAAITKWAQKHGFDALGTSFGISPELLSFWDKNNWFPVRVGHKPDPASRLPSAIFVHPLTAYSRTELLRLRQYLHCELAFRQHSKTLPAHVSKQLLAAIHQTPMPDKARQRRWQELGSAFAQGELNFLDYLPWLTAALTFNWNKVTSSPHLHVLQSAVESGGDLSELAKTMQLKGKKEALRTLRTICTSLHQQV